MAFHICIVLDFGEGFSVLNTPQNSDILDTTVKVIGDINENVLLNFEFTS